MILTCTCVLYTVYILIKLLYEERMSQLDFQADSYKNVFENLALQSAVAKVPKIVQKRLQDSMECERI